MVLFKLRLLLIAGPMLVAAGVYPLRGWWHLLVWIHGRRRVLSFPLPARYRRPMLSRLADDAQGWR